MSNAHDEEHWRKLLTEGHRPLYIAHRLFRYTTSPLGDTVNTAARLASSAAAGEALLSEPIYDAVAAKLPDLERQMLSIRGKEAPFAVRVLHSAFPG